MSETGGDRPDVSKAFWATQASPPGFGRIEPAGAKKLAGYDPGNPPVTPGEIPTGTDHNWLFGFWTDILQWLDGSHTREFSDIAEAIAATAAPQLIRVGEPGAGNRAIGEQVYSRVPAGFTQINDAASDGERAYYLDAGGDIEAVTVDDGVQVWQVTPGNVTDLALACAGNFIYLGGVLAVPGIVSLNRDTGAATAPDGASTQYAFHDLATNGVWIVGGGPSSAQTFAFLYDAAFSPPIEVLPGINHGAAVEAVAIDAVNFYFGGTRSAGVDVRAHDLVTRAQVWAVAIKVGLAPVINSIATDGELVYVGTDRVASGAGFANLFILQATDGTVIATADVQVGGTVDVVQVSVDQGTIYASIGTPDFGVVALRLGGPVIYQVAYIGTLRTCFDADGVGIIAEGGGTSVERYFVMDRPVTFQRALSTDPNRRPFHKLAIPLR